MAITYRTTKITERYDASSDARLSESTQGFGKATPSLNDVKAAETQPQSAEISDQSTRQSGSAGSSSSPNIDRFTQELHGWLGKHFFKVIVGTFVVLGPAIGFVWLVAEKSTKIDTRLEHVETGIREINTELKLSSDRLLKLELNSQSTQSPVSSKDKATKK